MIDAPGVYAISAAEYHADPVGPAPSLSSSIARTLLAYSPLHAYWSSPRLNRAFEPEESERFDLGSAAHALFLEGGAAVAIVDAENWTTKAARAARDLARMQGRIPLLTDQWDRTRALVDAVRERLTRHEDRPIPFTIGAPEQTLVWREGDVWCRARPDWLSDDHGSIDDLKTGAVSAHPDAWTRTTLWTMGHDVQAAFYLRGVRGLFGVDATFRFVVVENWPPYAHSVIGLTPEALVLAEKKVLLAIEMWSDCLRRNRWPAYPTRTCYAELPPYLEARWLEREVREEDRRARPDQMAIPDDGRPIGEQLAGLGGIA